MLYKLFEKFQKYRKLKKKKVWLIWEVNNKLFGRKNAAMEGTANFNPANGKIVVSRIEVEEVLLKYCMKTFENNEPLEQFKNTMGEKKEMLKNILDENHAKANKLSNDPLQQLLIFVGLIQEQHAQLEKDEIGCLYASYCYENQLVDKEIEDVVSRTMQAWKDKCSSKIKDVMVVYPPAVEINPDDVAGLFLATLEGAYIMARVMPEVDAVETYLEQYKTYLQLIFKQAS
jgi:hypothetical protein